MPNDDIFFVLKGWHNGDEELGLALEAGPHDAAGLDDGWYYLDMDSEHHGPYATRQAVQREFEAYMKKQGARA